MNINGVFNPPPVRAYRPNVSDSVLKSKFSDVLQNAQNADSFAQTSSVSYAADSVQSPSINETQRKLDEIAKAIENTDYSGMSKAEIYADIESKYSSAFDDYYACIACVVTKEQGMVNNQFISHLDEFGLRFMKGDVIREIRGYAGMSFEEIEDAIKEKYAGKTGIMDQVNLIAELAANGVLDHKYGNQNTLSLLCDMRNSLNQGSGDTMYSKDEMLSHFNDTGASSLLGLLMNNQYISSTLKDIYQSMLDDILDGITELAE